MAALKKVKERHAIFSKVEPTILSKWKQEIKKHFSFLENVRDKLRKWQKKETENKGKEKGYQMASASLFFIAAKVAGTFLETAESVP